jgi:hypothetical protein
MKRGVLERLAFTLFLITFLCSGVLAAVNSTNCDIVPRAACSGAGNYSVMGISALTNAHGETSITGTYPYVLCCGFGAGNRTCATTGENVLFRLSSPTNAHAEAPSQTNYLYGVCYEDLICIAISTDCGTGDAINYPINMLSLSSVTNAHIGRTTDYSNKICCGSSIVSHAQCTLTSATWSTTSATEGQTVQMQVIGSGMACDSNSIQFKVYEDGGLGSDTQILEGLNPSSGVVNFVGSSATAEWATIWHSGLVNPQYYFTATLVGGAAGTIDNEDERLTVTSRSSEADCETITACADYTNEGDCESDASLCGVAEDTAPAGVDCDAADTFCGCAWDSDAGTCGFVLSEITVDMECGNGYTLCHDPTADLDFCYPDSSCPSGMNSSCNGNEICETGEGCTCADCNGEQDSCVDETTCSSGTCYSATMDIETPRCEFGYTLCTNPSTSRNYCYPGTSCPDGNVATNNNGVCDLGFDGCLSSDCDDGDQDTCSEDTYCSGGRCYSIEGPKVLGSCKISQSVEKDCDEEPIGSKILAWTGTWDGEQSGAAYERCITGGEIVVPCPAQVQLPFFDYYEVGITLIAIALIYISMIFKKKLRRKKK